jgi:hypothetical protein
MMSILRTSWNYQVKASSLNASAAGCSAIHPTRRTSTPRNVTPGRTATSAGHGDSLGACLRQQFTIHDQVLERVNVYKYLERLLSQDDDDVQAVRAQIRKARTTWARVRNVLWAQNGAPMTSALFYKAVVQSVLFYSSETWVLSKTVLARLEGFHI